MSWLLRLLRHPLVLEFLVAIVVAAIRDADRDDDVDADRAKEK